MKKREQEKTSKAKGTKEINLNKKDLVKITTETTDIFKDDVCTPVDNSVEGQEDFKIALKWLQQEKRRRSKSRNEITAEEIKLLKSISNQPVDLGGEMLKMATIDVEKFDQSFHTHTHKRNKTPLISIKSPFK